uniref:uncharacterized protein LOC131140112 isoform X2 n=1 Tax=Doryrhamphus excisus TaxID=161450 RepID=UPI0025ADF5AB|nr:uncharacterized protein LOC131140112 isoform X2 [Doryrhamphus excisus]
MLCYGAFKCFIPLVDRMDHLSSWQPLKEEEEQQLEPPLPLRSDEEMLLLGPFSPPDHHMQDCGDRRCEDWSPACPRHQSCPCCQQDLQTSQNWIRCEREASVSVNVPQFSVPPEGAVSKVSATAVMAVDETAMAAAFSSHTCEKRRTTEQSESSCGLVQRSYHSSSYRFLLLPGNIFITYSSDSSTEMMALVDVLSKHGFRPAVGTVDQTFKDVDQTFTDVDHTKWEDSFLKDPSTPIIVAISPRYKADIEGCVEDSRGLHTKYIHTMMQHEFIQQGSLNFRFIPVLFLNASQKHVPGWLQNTRVYRWPQDTDDLLLRLLREETFVPPPVPVELTLIIRPVAAAP